MIKTETVNEDCKVEMKGTRLQLAAEVGVIIETYREKLIEDIPAEDADRIIDHIVALATGKIKIDEEDE